MNFVQGIIFCAYTSELSETLKKQLNENETKGYTNSHSFSTFIFCVTWKWNVGILRPQQKLVFLFYVKKYFHIKMRGPQKLMALLINQVLFSFEMRKYASFVEMNILQKHSYCHLIVEICVIHLWNFVTLIYWKIVLY